MKAMMAYLATALTFIGILLLGNEYYSLGWIIRILGDLIWIAWGAWTRPKGWTAVVGGEMLFFLGDSFGFYKTLN